MTMMGFTLNQWIEVYTERMKIRTKTQDGKDEPLETRYNRFERSIAENEEYKESMLGVEILASADPRYFEVSTMLKIGISPREWKALPLRERGELIAVYILNNKVEILERHTLESHRKQRDSKTRGSMFEKAGEGRGKSQDYWGPEGQ